MAIEDALLEPGERVQWSGKPNPLRYAQARSGIRIMIGLALVVLSEFLAIGARDGRLPEWLSPLVVVIAVLLLLSPLLLMWRARVTEYAVTDRRALVVVRRPFRHRAVVPFAQIGSVDLRLRTRGVADVLINEIVLGQPVEPQEGFLALTESEAGKVARMLRQAAPSR
jgi:hypothetical protein